MEEDENEVVEAELKISMHCNACERSVANAISKLKGVDKLITDMRRHRVVIIGKIDPEKVIKKLKKKTGKRVEIIVTAPHDPKQESDQKVVEEMILMDQQSHLGRDQGEVLMMNRLVLFGGSHHWTGCDNFTTMFSDENANACWIM